jgi:hypothetical protein
MKHSTYYIFLIDLNQYFLQKGTNLEYLEQKWFKANLQHAAHVRFLRYKITLWNAVELLV